MGGNGNCTRSRLSVCGLAVAFALVSALGTLVLGVLAHLFGWGADMVVLISTMYIGYAATAKGILFGVLWALLDGFVWGLLVAWIYNMVAKCCPCKGCKTAGACTCCQPKTVTPPTTPKM